MLGGYHKTIWFSSGFSVLVLIVRIGGCVNFQLKSDDFVFHMKACGLMDKLLQHE
jgi:hypothetical protein